MKLGKRHAHLLFYFGLIGSFFAVVLSLLVLPAAQSHDATAIRDALHETSTTTVPLPAPVEPLPHLPPDTQLALLYKAQLESLPISVHQELMQQDRAMHADLDTMELVLLERGVPVDRIPILSKGRPGTFWETPRGMYHVRTKEDRHYSSIGKVWMPYSMQFYGNFFIHGWPYHDDGTDVPPGYSGGCIRLANTDAQKIYEFATIGTPILVTHGEGKLSTATTSMRYLLRGEGEPPEVIAKSFIAADIDTGAILWERKGEDIVPLRETTALLSSMTSLETINQYRVEQMSKLVLGKAIPRGRGGAYPDTVPVGALIYPLLFEANDTAAMAFAGITGKKVFVRYMNEKAAALGLTNSLIVSPDTDPENVGTARDIFRLVRSIALNKRFILEASLRDRHAVESDVVHDVFTWENTNPFYIARDAQYRGGVSAATGTLGAAATVWSLSLGEFDARRIAIIVLESPDVLADTETIRDFITAHYVYGQSDAKGAVVVEGNESVSDMLDRVRELFLLHLRVKNGA